MQNLDGVVVFSATDVNNFLECEHVTQLELAIAEGRLTVAPLSDAHATLLAQKGDAHEQAYLHALREAGTEIVEIDCGPRHDDLSDAVQRTVAAMRAGAPVIYQAAFLDGQWRGHADFLERVDRPSMLGAWSYEVADTKLARHTKPYFLLQLCFYSEQVARLQGVAPERMHVVLGTRLRESFRYSDFSVYFRRVRTRFLSALSRGVDTYPYPVEHCSLCQFLTRCEARWSTDDHLSLVADMRRGQVVRLNDVGISTVADLATASAATTVRIGNATFNRLREQAALQTQHRVTGLHSYTLLPPEPQRGFSLLPRPSAGDVFFDMEGDPYWEAGRGLEYLFGCVTNDNGQPRFHAFWAHDRVEEKLAFEAFVDFVTARLKQYPDLHVYHYASYELTALKRLMGEHGTRENEVDDLIERHVLVDLFTVVRQTLRISYPGYSLKQVRKFFMNILAAGTVADAEDSILAYEQWINTRSDGLLRAIGEYNEQDCLSTLGLREWLLERRIEAESTFSNTIAWYEPAAVVGPDEDATVAVENIARMRLKEALLEGVPAEVLTATPEQAARWLLAQLIDYHKREDKPAWWAYFNRLESSDSELLENREAIAGLATMPHTTAQRVKLSLVHTLTFPAQEHKLGPGEVLDPKTKKFAGTIIDIDDAAGTLTLRRGPQLKQMPLPEAVVIGEPFDTTCQRIALTRLATEVTANGVDGSGRYRANCDILRREPPRRRERQGSSLIQTVDLEETKRITSDLDESYLFIQGPPGSGKTWTGAQLIVHLLRQGKRIGVAAPSHRAIHNLLDEIERVAAAENVSFRGLKKSSARNEESAYNGRYITSEEKPAQFSSPPPNVLLLAGTAWLFAGADMDSTLDYLFIDEAGQVSLADALAMGTSARNLVLLGDPLQLAQVSQGVHPGRAGDSVLEHLLGDSQTVGEDRGIFLTQTRRMHPSVCGFISEVVYESRLASWENCARQEIKIAGVSETGIRYVPVEHVGNAQRSTEEANAVRAEAERLLTGGLYTDCYGVTRPLQPTDIMVVAPYNAQVRCLRETLQPGIEVGTVDKFQGRQAPVVFFSMTTSSGDELPRDLEFLFSRNRLNVAVSRARCLAIVVASPQLLEIRCRTVEQMQMVNALCRFVEIAEEQLSPQS